MSRLTEDEQKQAAASLLARMTRTVIGYLIFNIAWNVFLDFPIIAFLISFFNLRYTRTTCTPVVPLPARNKVAGITIGFSVALLLSASLGRAMQIAFYLRSYGDIMDLWISRLLSPSNFRENWFLIVVAVAVTAFEVYRIHHPSNRELDEDEKNARLRSHRRKLESASAQAAAGADESSAQPAAAQADHPKPQQAEFEALPVPQGKAASEPASGVAAGDGGWQLPSYAPGDLAAGELPGLGEAPAQPIAADRIPDRRPTSTEPQVGLGYGGPISADVDPDSPANFDADGRLLPPPSGQTFDPTERGQTLSSGQSFDPNEADRSERPGAR